MRPKPMTMLRGERLRQFEEVALVHDFEDQLLDVVGLVRIVGHQRVERRLLALDVVERRPFRHAGREVRRQEIDQPAHLQQALDVVVVGAVGDRGFGGVHRGAAELLGGDDLVGHGLHHVGAGDEHVARVAHHEDEIGHRRRIDVAAGARAHDDGNLRDDARGDDVALEHLAVAAERRDAFLDARAAGIEQADDRRARLHRHVLDLDDLLRVRLRQRAAEHGEILGEDEHGAAVHRAPAGDDAVAGDLGLLHAEIGASGARRTCRTPRTSPCPSGARCARARSACRACAAPRCAPRRRRRARCRGAASSLSRMSFMAGLAESVIWSQE